MTGLTVPGTIDELHRAADAFLSTGWTLAAAVWAWTELQPGKRTDLAQKCARYSLKEFAALGLRGLRSRRTVAEKRAIWQSAIDAGLACAVNPGDVVEIPDAPFGLIEDGPEPDPEPEKPLESDPEHELLPPPEIITFTVNPNRDATCRIVDLPPELKARIDAFIEDGVELFNDCRHDEGYRAVLKNALSYIRKGL